MCKPLGLYNEVLTCFYIYRVRALRILLDFQYNICIYTMQGSLYVGSITLVSCGIRMVV